MCELFASISLGDELAVDSLDLIELAIAVEDVLGVRLPDDGLRWVRTYGELEGLVIVQLARSS